VGEPRKPVRTPSVWYLRIQSEQDGRFVRMWKRSALTFFRLVRLLPLSALFSLLPAIGQVSTQPPETTPPQQAPQTSTAQAAKPAVPDYPDPRTPTIGVFYWLTGPGTNPSLTTGKLAPDLETLSDLGKAKRTPDIQIDLPITRTGELRFEGFLTKGDGNQTLTTAPDLFGTQFNVGNNVSTQYQITGAKLYLDDLLFPHKFPVSRFRIKSLWEVQYVKMKTTIDAPLILTGLTATGSHQIILPTFGLAAEYAIAPHVLLRVAGSGFGLYHKADIWDGDATIAWRMGKWEVVGGGKAFHFKTSPKKSEYMSATLAGAFVGLRWHW
jgi:hypothetical protein